MLLITSSGFVEILREPQFPQHFTVCGETEASLQPLVAKTYSEDMTINSQTNFPYVTYAFEDEVRAAFKISNSSWTVTESPVNLSPEPLGYFAYCTNPETGAWQKNYVYTQPLQFHFAELDEIAGDWPIFRFYPVYSHASDFFENDLTEDEDGE